MEQKTFSTIGKVTRRKEGISRVTGKEIFSSDVSLPNMLYARRKRVFAVRLILVMVVYYH